MLNYSLHFSSVCRIHTYLCTGKEICCAASRMSSVQRGTRSLTHFDICSPQEVYYPTETMSKPEKLLNHFLCPYWKFIQCKPIYSEREREVEREEASLGCAVSAMCQGEKGKRRMEKEKNTTSSGDFFTKKYNFLYSLQLLSSILAFLCAQWLFRLLLICFIFFRFKGETFVNSFIFSWGVAFLARLIFGSKTASGFNLRGLYYQKRMFSECRPVTYNPLQGMHACMQFMFCCPYERLLAHVFNKERSELEEERGWKH